MTKTIKIITTHVYPPIPVRAYDWSAHYDGHEEEGPVGWGKTKAEALADLVELSADYPKRCKTSLVAPDNGDCLHCFAANGEECRERRERADRKEQRP